MIWFIGELLVLAVADAAIAKAKKVKKRYEERISTGFGCMCPYCVRRRANARGRPAGDRLQDEGSAFGTGE